MNDADHPELLATARLLRAVERIDWLATGMTLLAMAALLFGTPNRVLGAVAVALGLIAKLYRVRISFDARLLEDVACARLTTAELDAALTAMQFTSPAKTARPWPVRCRGARRLAIVYAIVTTMQAAAVVVMGMRL